MGDRSLTHSTGDSVGADTDRRAPTRRRSHRSTRDNGFISRVYIHIPVLTVRPLVHSTGAYDCHRMPGRRSERRQFNYLSIGRLSVRQGVCRGLAVSVLRDKCGTHSVDYIMDSLRGKHTSY
jgi:hypothetical protein